MFVAWCVRETKKSGGVQGEWRDEEKEKDVGGGGKEWGESRN